MNLLERKITLFQTIYQKEEPIIKTIGYALTRIQSGRSKSTIEDVRAGRKDKTNLPVVCWSGQFARRSDDALMEHSGVTILDFDKLEDVIQVKRQLAEDKYIFAIWVSPSGNGLKALVQLKFPEKHRDQFNALINYFSKNYGINLDKSGKNESRACFESYDSDLVINTDAEVYSGVLVDQVELQKINALDKGTDYRKLNIAARIIRLAEDGEKHHALLKAATLVGGYIAAGKIEEVEAIRVLTREIAKRDVDSLENAKITIQDGIAHGKNLPIREVIEQESDAMKAIELDEMDLSFISSEDDDYHYMVEFAEGRIPEGLKTGNNKVDDHFRFKKEMFIGMGHSNVGKTTFMLYLMIVASAKHSWRWLVYSSENKTAMVKIRLMEFYLDRPIKAMNPKERKEAYKWVSKHFTLISNHEVYSYTDLILMCKKTMQTKKVDGIFIDPYNSLKVAASKNSIISTHDYHYQALRELLTFSVNHNVAVWINMHAMTEAQRRKGPDGLPTAPYAEDTEGGGKNVNVSDSVATIHRKVQASTAHDRRIVEFHIRKVRTKELGGCPTSISDPLLFRMNTDGTGFRSLDGEDLYDPIAQGTPVHNLSQNTNYDLEF